MEIFILTLNMQKIFSSFKKMKIKNIIIVIFLLFNLNLISQPVQFGLLKYRHTIVRQITYDNDKLTGAIVENNRDYLFREFISIKIQVLIAEKDDLIYNTS